MFAALHRAFLYPSDLQLELEYWTETGEYDEDELHEVRNAGWVGRGLGTN